MRNLVFLSSIFMWMAVFVCLMGCVKGQSVFYYEDENIRFYQMTLVPANGSINKNTTAVTFTKPTDYIENVTGVELALCGFNLQNNVNMEYNASITYTLGSFNISVQAFNETSFQYISFYAILFRSQASSYFYCKSACQQMTILNENPNKNRTQFIIVTMANNRSSGTNYVVKPFIKSMRARQGGNNYTRLQVTYSAWDMFTPRITLIASTYESVITQACVTVVVLLSNAVGSNYTYQVVEHQIRQFTAASIKALPANFGITAAHYGPIFNKKCLIGFPYLYFRDGIKQIYFDATKAGFTSLTQNTPQYFYAEMSIFCVTRTKTCGQNQGIQTAIQQCVNCSVMIKNCALCLTESQCTSCANGYFIDLSKKCCPTYLLNCSICSLGNTCTQCADGFYSSQTGNCAPCSSAVTNCARCQNGTFCYECQKGYEVGNYTSCRPVQLPNDENTDTSNSQLSIWAILFIVFAGVCGLLLALILVLCCRMKRKNNDIGSQQNYRTNPKDQKQKYTPSKQMQNNKLTQIDPNVQVQQMVYESELKPGSLMALRLGSKLNSNFTNIKPLDKNTNDRKTNEMKPNEINKTSKISPSTAYEVQKSNPNNIPEIQPHLQSDRGFLQKNAKPSSFLPQYSKSPSNRNATGEIQLKANYYK